MNTQKLDNDIDHLINEGNEAALEEFVLVHFTEFTQREQSDIFAAIYTDAVERRAAAANLTNVQQQGLDAMEKIEALKAALTKTD